MKKFTVKGDEGKAFLEALKAHYTAKIQVAEATLMVYFNKPVGIGEHSELLVEFDKHLNAVVDAKDKLEYLNSLETE